VAATPTFYKILPMIVYFVSILGSVGAGILLYNSLSTPTEKIQNRLRLRRGFTEKKDKTLETIADSSLEKTLKDAGNPLNLNALKFHILRWSLTIALILNYYLVPYFLQSGFNKTSILAILLFFILTMPEMKYSAVRIGLNKIIEYRKAKLNSEIFILHDLLVGEIEMMSQTRVNTYNILRQMTPYFSFIQPQMNRLITNWGEKGPDLALDDFAKELNTPEAVSLVSVLKTLDYNDRIKALKALKGMGDLFIRKQIENHRRKKKMIVDLFSIPINSAVFIIMLNFLVLIVYMVIGTLGDGSSLL